MAEPTTLRVPQARVLKALLALGSGSLTRANLAEIAGFTRTSGTTSRALRGISKGSSSGTPHPGLLELGYVIRTDLDIDGLWEAHYKITDKGIEAVTVYLNEKNCRTYVAAKRKNWR